MSISSVNQMLRQAKTAIKRGDLAQAKQLYQSILEKYPGNQAAKTGLQSLSSQQTASPGTTLDQTLEHLIGLYNKGEFQGLIQKVIPLTQHHPDHPLLWNIRGAAHFQLGELDQTADCYTQIIRLKPKNAEAHNNLGVVFKSLERYGEAIQSYNTALQYRSDYAEAHNNLGVVFNKLGRHEEAIQSYNRGIQYRPDYAEAHNNLGTLFNNLGRYEEAIQSYNTALQYRSDYVGAHHNLALVLLHQGKLKQGWQEYEWRLKKKEFRKLFNQIESCEQGLWDGKESLQGKTILLHAEQGLGDTIQFCRYAKLLEQSGATVILSVQPPLQRLLQSLSPTLQIVGKTLHQKFDTHCHLMSLPYLLQTELDTIPADIPYLFAEPERQARWQALLDSHDYRIGIVWQGSRTHKSDHLRSFPLFHFAGLSRLAGVRLIRLQKDEGLQIAEYRDQVNVVELDETFDSGEDAFLDSAAIMTCLDLVITSDTAIAHLAGALGVPVWVVLPQPSEWRWLEDRTDSPWYPGMRLFRQAEPGDWTGVFQQIEQALISELPTKRQ